MQDLSRRKFFVDGSLIVSGAIAALALGSGLPAPRSAFGAQTDFSESNCGPQGVPDGKILVTYASMSGSTGGVAEAIGKMLCSQGAAVDVRMVENVQDLSAYRAAVVGSAVRSGKWLPQTTAFVQQHKKALGRMPVAYFLTCLALYQDNDQTRQVARSYMDSALAAAPDIAPVDIGLFAGVLDYEKLSFMVRTVMKSKMKKRGVPEGDHRNWTAIRAWARGISTKLLPAGRKKAA